MRKIKKKKKQRIKKKKQRIKKKKKNKIAFNIEHSELSNIFFSIIRTRFIFYF